MNALGGGVQRKRNDNEISKREAAEMLAGIADLIEGKIEEVNLSLYPVTGMVVRNSLVTIQEVMCHSAGDAIYVYTADNTNCNYFVTAEKDLASKIKSSSLRNKLVAVDIDDLNDTLRFFYDYE